jgi:hypothetical protein
MPLCLQENIAVSGVPSRPETPYISGSEELVTPGNVPEPVPIPNRDVVTGDPEAFRLVTDTDGPAL